MGMQLTPTWALAVVILVTALTKSPKSEKG
jgi:hypothetical protein